MLGLLTLWTLALRRLRARWGLLLPLLIGSVLAVALLSSTFIYGDAVRRLGLTHAFAQEGRPELDIDLLNYYAPTDPVAYQTVKNEMEVAISRNVNWFVDGQTRGMKGATFYVNQAAKGGQAIDPSPEAIAGVEASRVDPRLRAFFFYQTDFEKETTLVAGERPAAVVVEVDREGKPQSSPEIPAMILDETARRQGLQIGDRVLIVPHWEDISTYGVARVAGIVRRNDPQARYWGTFIQERYVTEWQEQNFIPLFVSEESYLKGVGRLFPRMLSDYGWSLFVDPSKIDVRNVGVARYGLERLEDQLRGRLRSFSKYTALDSTLAAFATRDLFGRIPLLIVVLMILGIISYYLVMVSNVVVDRHLEEIALLRSRGAETSQVLALYLWEALAIVAVAFFIGPLVAALATSLLGLTPAFSDLTGGDTLPVKLSSDAFLMALAGAALAFAAILLPTLKASRLDLLRYKAGVARPPAASFLNRYYVDIFVSIIAGLFYWELTQRGTLVTAAFSGERDVDQALLAAPALFLLAIALLFLRFFPLIARALGWVASSFGRAWLVLGLWQMGRNSLQYTGPILLLMLASSVAMFAANFGGTVDRSYRDRALYASGGDMRLEGITLSPRGPSISFLDQYGDIPEARTLSPVYRTDASPAGSLFSSNSYRLLGVDPSTFGQVAWYRDDFSKRSLDSLMDTLEEDTQGPHGIALPAEAVALGVWVRPATPRRDVQLRARIADSNGRYQDYLLGTMASNDWQFLETDLFSESALRFRGIRLAPPLRLVSLYIRQQGGMSLTPGAVYLDDLQARTGSSEQPLILESFEGVSSMGVIKDTPLASGDSLESSATTVRDGRGSSGVFIWGSGSLLGTRGLFLGKDAGSERPLKVIASRSFLEAEGVSPGSQMLLWVDGHRVPVEIAAAADYFPTLDPFDGGFLAANLSALLRRLNTAETAFERQPNELWLATDPDLVGSARGALAESLRQRRGAQVVDREELLASFQADPLVAAGWDGILSLAFIAVLFATLMGFSVYSYVQAQRRRVEFAMLRSIGLSFRGLVSIVLLEQLVVVVVGLGLGSWMGIQLTSVLMPFLGLTERGTQVLPPFAVVVNWSAIIATYSIMAAVFLAATVSLIGVFSRTAIQRALRFGEV